MRIKFVLPFLILLIATDVYSQRRKVDFVSLINRASAPRVFIDHIMIPADSNQTDMSIIFRFDNDFLPYKKISPSDKITPPQGKQFYVTTRLSTDIFRGKSKQKGNPEIYSRDAWIDTLFTETFEETESRKLYASGALTSTLQPGMYHYILQLSLMGNPNERNSQKRNVVAPDWDKKDSGEIILASGVSSDVENKVLIELLNMEDNVPFGKDFYALIRIPGYKSDSDYEIKVSRARPSKDDTTKADVIYSEMLDTEFVYENVTPGLADTDNPSVELNLGNGSYTYAVVKIPNTTFENAPYLMELTESEGNSLAKTFFKSYWPDMPASLYNLDVSIEMLRFIVKEDQIDQIKSGNNKEKERKFREFWDSKDPTPNTVYNELMAEYYRRIDYAFKEFGNRGNLNGHESDQGEIYIKFGPPNSKERQFPTNGDVLEIWEYPNRKFVFKAQSGFGDFNLISTE